MDLTTQTRPTWFLSRRNSIKGVIIAWLCLLATGSLNVLASAGDFSQEAQLLDRQLVQKVIPYWLQDVDAIHDGYLLADDGRGHKNPTEKQLVSQSRMIWTFARLHRVGKDTSDLACLRAAEAGYLFLISHMLDREQGGYYWVTTLDGQPTDTRKILYGQSFALYALVEYYQASGDRMALTHAMDLYRTLRKRSYDASHGGWVEHFERNWTPILTPGNNSVEVNGCKSANTHLHLMEALTELYLATKDSKVAESLEESLNINKKYFYPANPSQSCFHRYLDWSVVTDPSSAGLSYGHNVEFAWLMIQAERALGKTPSWAHFDAHLQHALKCGWDSQNGGLFHRGIGDQPASDKDKIWWVQAEMLAALSDALAHQANPQYAQALKLLLDWIQKKQTSPDDGIWYDTVAADGQVKNPAKAHSWKANYHDIRAILKFMEFAGKK